VGAGLLKSTVGLQRVKVWISKSIAEQNFVFTPNQNTISWLRELSKIIFNTAADGEKLLQGLWFKEKRFLVACDFQRVLEIFHLLLLTKPSPSVDTQTPARFWSYFSYVYFLISKYITIGTTHTDLLCFDIRSTLCFCIECSVLKYQ